MRLLGLLCILPGLVAAEDAHLAVMRALLVPMREGHPVNFKIRGATPALTEVKHELIAWVESRLPEMQWTGYRWEPDPVVLQARLNDELERAGLICGSGHGPPCPEWSQLGFLGRLVFDMRPGILVVKTSVQIDICGEDQSAYAYEVTDDHWRRFWQSEQNDYRGDKYLPQRFDEVAISSADWTPGADKTEHLILTLGHMPWCTSVWQDVYYRVWHTKATYTEPLLLLDEKEWSDIDGAIRGVANGREVLLEYSVSGVEGGFTRPEIRHYALKNRGLERVDPVALGPHHFCAFWLTRLWPEVVPWTAQDSRTTLHEWRRKHAGNFNEFGSPSCHCKGHPDQWQVSTDYGKDGDQRVYFLIRWRPPYRFTMLAVGDKPWADCTEEDPEADEEHDLFFGR